MNMLGQVCMHIMANLCFTTSQSGHQDVFWRLASALGFEVVRDQERYVERLLVVESRVTMRSVIEREILVLKLHRAADTFRLQD